MTMLPFTEHEGMVVVQIPGCMEQVFWQGFRERIHRQFVDRGMLHLVLDCEECADLPSIAFGVFTCLVRDLRRVGGTVHLVHISERIRLVLVRTRLDECIPVRGTLTEVVRRPPPLPPD